MIRNPIQKHFYNFRILSRQLSILLQPHHRRRLSLLVVFGLWNITKNILISILQMFMKESWPHCSPKKIFSRLFQSIQTYMDLFGFQLLSYFCCLHAKIYHNIYLRLGRAWIIPLQYRIYLGLLVQYMDLLP